MIEKDSPQGEKERTAASAAEPGGGCRISAAGGRINIYTDIFRMPPGHGRGGFTYEQAGGRKPVSERVRASGDERNEEPGYQEGEEPFLISREEFFDLLMEQQEQM